MKIAIAGGHSAAARGAVGYIDEYEKDRDYVERLIPALEEAGHIVVDCSNEETTVNDELRAEVYAANNSDADVFMAVHFNAGGGTGTECWYYTGSDRGRELSEQMSANVASALGLRDRGAKDTTGLYVIRKTNMTAILLEVCFVDTWQDAEAWHNAPWDDLVAAVVNAFNGISFEGSNSSESSSDNNDVSGGLDIDGVWGTATTSAVQNALGTPVDGIVSGQASSLDACNRGGLTSASWKHGSGGSLMVRALQEKVGATVDGYFGRDTCRTLQRYLGTYQDGYVDNPSNMVKELQRRINDGTF